MGQARSRATITVHLDAEGWVVQWSWTIRDAYGECIGTKVVPMEGLQPPNACFADALADLNERGVLLPLF